MVKIQGNFKGEITPEPIRYTRYYTKRVLKNNNTSGKILVPSDLIDEEVVVLLPEKKAKSKQRRIKK